MCHLISKASSYISGILRNMKSSMLLVAALFISSFAVVAQAEDINLTVTAPDGSSSVRLTGPWWSWDPNGGPEATSNGDGTWTVTMGAPAENMQYLWVVDGSQENLIDNAANAECTAEIDGGSLITDYSAWANRVWVLGSGDAANTYDACAGTAAPEPEVPTLTLTVTADATTVGITGPWWGWGTDGPVATDNGDGTWSVVFDPAPTDTMEYKWLLDGVQEDLVTPAAAGECTAEIDAGTINTDYSAWGNRYWTVGSGDRSETAGACAGTAAQLQSQSQSQQVLI
ncbi:MAG: hypothetical protein ACPG57_04095 [Porticoccaceae bacterium]